MDPGNVPLLVVFGFGVCATLGAALLRRSHWLQVSALVLGAAVMGALQSAIRSQSFPLVMAGIGLILGSATVMTRGDPIRFFDDDSSPEALDVSARIQARTLLLAAIPVAVMIFFYRDRLQ